MQSLLLGSPEVYSPLALMVASFCLGVLVSPLGSGVFFLALFLIVWEILFFGYCLCRKIHWCLPIRSVAILAYVLGWIIGRQFTDNHPLEPGLPESLDRWLHPDDFSDGF